MIKLKDLKSAILKINYNWKKGLNTKSYILKV